ncbi:MAG: MerR family transcriptional regulator [Lachnospirales bacterium]
MVYSIGEIAEKMGLSVHTLRYYDKTGILPLVERSENGRRVFTDKDLVMLNTIECLKKTGMQLKDIKQYIDWCAEGPSTVKQRFELFEERKKAVEEEIESLKKTLKTINFKYDFYKKAMEEGYPDICDNDRFDLAQRILEGTL